MDPRLLHLLLRLDGRRRHQHHPPRAGALDAALQRPGDVRLGGPGPRQGRLDPREPPGPRGRRRPGFIRGGGSGWRPRGALEREGWGSRLSAEGCVLRLRPSGQPPWAELQGPPQTWPTPQYIQLQKWDSASNSGASSLDVHRKGTLWTRFSRLSLEIQNYGPPPQEQNFDDVWSTDREGLDWRQLVDHASFGPRRLPESFVGGIDV